MTMTSGLRKFTLTLHVISSVGWLGAVAVFLVLAITGLTNKDTQMVRSIYLAMGLAAKFVIVPLNLASLLTGLILTLGTKWGLFRHYWILTKFIVTILSTLVLQVHMQPIILLANVASERTLSSADLGLQIQLVVASGAALLVLLVNTTLAMYKPRGMTRYGQRKQQEHRTLTHP
jgi:hypothetical protein